MAIDPTINSRGDNVRGIIYKKSETATPSQVNTLLTDPTKYTKKTEIDKPKGLDNVLDEKGENKPVKIDKAPRAMNPYYNLRVRTVDDGNYPLTDDEMRDTENAVPITPTTLIEHPRGASQFKVDDFLYVKNFGKVPLNRLITLRRFAFPVFDDIFSTEAQSEPDIARVVGFSDQSTNKYSDLLSFSAGLRWKDLQSKSEKAEMHGEQSGVDGVMGKVLKFVDPQFGADAIRGGNEMSFNPQHDSNRVYGTIDSISETRIRDVGLDFAQDMEVTFEWEMRSIGGVNQKSAFLDILSNIILMCTNDGEFWGGARYWVGTQPSKYMKDMKALDPKNFNDFVSKSTDAMRGFVEKQQSMGGKDAKTALRNIADNAMNLALGRMLNVLGRPAIPMMNSLLTGTPVGMWHLTVGNPLNPILSAGDLILEGAQVSFGDELGYDDFPTTMKLVATLKHAKPRDRGGIESIFNAGKGRTYLKPKDVFSDIDMKKHFGEYKETDVRRNKQAVWKFLKKEE